jgi:hypothetical protein
MEGIAAVASDYGVSINKPTIREVHQLPILSIDEKIRK